jgi:hypothetical protein
MVLAFGFVMLSIAIWSLRRPPDLALNPNGRDGARMQPRSLPEQEGMGWHAHARCNVAG